MTEALHLGLGGEENWKWKAACHGEWEMFDSPDAEGRDQEGELARKKRVAAAKKTCGDCPVIYQCRKEALENKEPSGVWGGMTELERSRLLEKRNRNRNKGNIKP